MSREAWKEVKTDRFWFDELRLFVSSYPYFFDQSSRWQKRCDDWETHVNLSACIHSMRWPHEVQGKKTGNTHQYIPWKTERIEFLFRHLNILDTKFGMLLTFNSLLLVAINVLVNILLNLMKGHEVPQGSGSVSWVIRLSIAFGISWLLTTFLCLYGERRLVWGDLGFIQMYGGEEVRLKWGSINMITDENDVIDAEAKHVKALIIAVAKRTNKFRVAIRLTTLNVLLLAFTFIAALCLLKHAYHNIAFF